MYSVLPLYLHEKVKTTELSSAGPPKGFCSRLNVRPADLGFQISILGAEVELRVREKTLTEKQGTDFCRDSDGDRRTVEEGHGRLL